MSQVIPETISPNQRRALVRLARMKVEPREGFQPWLDFLPTEKLKRLGRILSGMDLELTSTDPDLDAQAERIFKREKMKEKLDRLLRKRPVSQGN